jgi:hypothetical protein
LEKRDAEREIIEENFGKIEMWKRNSRINFGKRENR